MAKSKKCHTLGNALLDRQAAERREQTPITRNQALDIDVSLLESGDREQEIAISLDRLQPADREHDEVVVGQSEFPTNGHPVDRAKLSIEAIEIDSVTQHLDTVPRKIFESAVSRSSLFVATRNVFSSSPECSR